MLPPFKNQQREVIVMTITLDELIAIISLIVNIIMLCYIIFTGNK